eukprot:TRINITY_DN42110_c0_g1_i1.p1 TRINITY_DN42110_c0_g1~~TRINITY_DN42110_c0_g1_i1.p1  ORF type:complete len:522 (-),score=117.64 TRINITY_DN42110_c0_g1_i1:20-1561(-)
MVAEFLLKLIPSDVLAASLTVCCIFLGLVFFACSALLRRGRRSSVASYRDRNFLHHSDLVNPEVRGDHLTFNLHLHSCFAGQRFVPVQDEEGCFVAFTHGTCKEVMNDHSSFSSNPFPDGRLVALNTMSKADHSRVLRFVHSHYAQEGVERLETRLREVIERCTDELTSGVGDAVCWAKRIHMSSTLARLGVDTAADRSWAAVDEAVELNDAMVALVAPLGGVGLGYETLPWHWWLRVALGLLQSLLPLLQMAHKLGVRCAWEIIRPDVTVLCPPRRPRMGLWWRPELLPLVPRYFVWLHSLLEQAGKDSSCGGPLAGMREGVARGDLTLAEALTLMVQLMVNMTSANALCSLVFRLASEKAAREKVAADPEGLADSFVREVLRLDAPLQRNPRRCVKLGPKWKASCEPGPREGDQVLLFLGAANMDPAVYDCPGEFRLERPGEAAALSFGSGMHYCLGSSLVKLELRLALQCILKKCESVELEGSYERLTDVDVGNWGFRRLPVRLKMKKKQ